MTTYTFAVTGMHCASCGILIDETLEDEVPGVTRSETSVGKGRTIVTTDGTATAEAISAAISGVDSKYRARLESPR